MGTKRKLGNTSEERQANFEKIIYLYVEKNFTLEDIAKKFNASKQAINQFLVKRGFVPEKEKDIKNKQFRAKAKNTIFEAKLEQMARERKTQQVEKTIAQTKAKKYKNALKEIKKIVLEACLCCGECQTEFSTKNYCDFSEILQKINEVLNA